MNDLDTFETLRPDVRPLSAEQQASMRSQLFGGSSQSVPMSSGNDDLMDFDIDTTRNTQQPHRWLIGVAAALIAVAGITGIWASASNRQDPPASAQQPSVTDPIESGTSLEQQGPTLVPDDFAPLGLSLTPAGLQSEQQVERSAVQRRVYASAKDPTDPWQMVTVAYAPDTNDGSVMCEFVDSASSFEIAGGTGWMCRPGSTTSAGWVFEGVAVQLEAGPGVNSDEILALARSLHPVPPATPGAGAPIDLAPDPLPAGWTTLVGTDLLPDQSLLENSWRATGDGTPNDSQYVWVRSWTGGDDTVVYDFMPLESQRAEVRGHAGYLYESSSHGENGPVNVTLTWIESPGLVISVDVGDSSGVSADVLNNLAKWQIIDAANFNE